MIKGLADLEVRPIDFSLWQKDVERLSMVSDALCAFGAS
jgi:hypothetical protein